MKRRWLATAVLMLAVGSGAVAGQARQGRFAGRPVADALRELAREGLSLVFSDRLVRPEMTVVAEPRARSPRGILAEILAPHGLQVQAGPRDRLLIVRAPVGESRRAEPGLRRADVGSVRVGFRQGDSREALPVSSVRLRGDDGVAEVSADGRILVTGLAAGPRFIEVVVPGFVDPTALPAMVKAGSTSDVVFDLTPRAEHPAPRDTALTSVELASVHGVDHRETVDVTTPSGSTAVGPSVTAVATADLMKGAGHGGNVLTPLQSLPGVKNGRDFDGRLVVRGGAPDQNLVLIDGVEVLGPYHVFGLSSVFLPAAVESLEFAAGGFDARYGDRLSSLLSVRSRTGRAAGRPAGTAGAGLLDADLMVEGGIPRVAGGSWLVAGRYSFIDLLAKSVLESMVPRFADFHAKVSWAQRPGHRLSWLGMLGHERSDYRETDDYPEDWTLRTRVPTALASVSLESTMGSRAAWRGVASVYDVHDGLTMRGDVVSDARGTLVERTLEGRVAHVSFDRHVAVRDWAVRQDLTVDSSPRHTWDTGFEAHWLQTRWRWLIDGDRNPSLGNRSVPWPYGIPGASLPGSLDSRIDHARIGGWLQHRAALGSRVTAQAGLRLDYSGLTRGTALSPRGSVTWRLGDTARFRGTAGMYAQHPGYEKLLQSDSFVDLGAARGLRSERAAHVAAGVDWDLARGVSVRAEVYRKTYANLIVGRLETENERLARVARYDFGPWSDDVPVAAQVTTVPVNGATGMAHGIDIQIVRRAARADTTLTGWVSYSYAVARRQAYGQTVPFDFDRRHAASVVAQYRLHPAVTVSGTARIASGSPWTPPIGLRIAAREDVGDADGDGDVSEWIPARDPFGQFIYTHDTGGPAQVNSARLPVYARLDARVTYRPGGPQGRWSFYFDMINLLNRTNPGLMSCRVGGVSGAGIPIFVQEPEFSVPILPSFGARVRF